jgi:phospholipid/cholesterol/gamma-HCH transport system substrate-binding protein
MDYLFYQVAAINGFDADGHYLRAGLILNACSQYAISPLPDCLSKFSSGDESSARAASASSVPAYADTRRSDDLRQLDAFFHGKKLDLGSEQPTAASGSAAQHPATTAQPQQTAPAARSQQTAQPQETTPTAQPQTTSQQGALLDYLLGGDN